MGCGFIVTSEDGAETQPEEFVTVNVYVPVTSDDIVLDVPVPV